MLSPKVYLISGSILSVLILGYGYVHERDKRIRNEAAASARIERDSVLLIGLRDSLGRTQRKVDTIRVVLRGTFTTYDSIRKTITITDTSRFVVVDTSYVRTADSVRRVCSSLEISCGEERLRSSAVISNLTNQNKDLKLIISTQKDGRKWVWAERATLVVLGSGAGYGACKLSGT